MKVLSTKHFLWINLLISFHTFLYPMYFIIWTVSTSIYLTESLFSWQKKKKGFVDFFIFSAPCGIRLYNFYYFLKWLLYLHQTTNQELNRLWIQKPSIFKLSTSKRDAFPWWCITEYNTCVISAGFTQSRAGDLQRAESQTPESAVRQPCSGNSPFAPWQEHWVMNLTSIP